MRGFFLFLLSQFRHILTGDPTHAGVQYEPDTFLRFDSAHTRFDIAAAALPVPGADSDTQALDGYTHLVVVILYIYLQAVQIAVFLKFPLLGVTKSFAHRIIFIGAS